MIPKEKAIQLLDKFNKPDTTHYPYVHNAQQCALIAVDEMIKELEYGVGKSATEWWHEVKQEIEKL